MPRQTKSGRKPRDSGIYERAFFPRKLPGHGTSYALPTRARLSLEPSRDSGIYEQAFLPRKLPGRGTSYALPTRARLSLEPSREIAASMSNLASRVNCLEPCREIAASMSGLFSRVNGLGASVCSAWG